MSRSVEVRSIFLFLEKEAPLPRSPNYPASHPSNPIGEIASRGSTRSSPDRTGDENRASEEGSSIWNKPSTWFVIPFRLSETK